MSSQDTQPHRPLESTAKDVIEAAGNGDWPAPGRVERAKEEFVDEIWRTPAARTLTRSEMELLDEHFAIDDIESLTLDDVFSLLQETGR